MTLPAHACPTCGSTTWGWLGFGGCDLCVPDDAFTVGAAVVTGIRLDLDALQVETFQATPETLYSRVAEALAAAEANGYSEEARLNPPEFVALELTRFAPDLEGEDLGDVKAAVARWQAREVGR